MKRIRRFTLFSSILVIGTLVLSACSLGGGNSNSPSNTTIAVWGWRQEDVAAYKKIFAIYEAQHPGIKVNYVPYLNTEYDTILATGLKGSSGPDVVQLRSYGILQPLTSAGELVALDGQVTGLDQFAKPVLDGARSTTDSKIYGVPFAVQTLQVIYNKEIFKKFGLSKPKTWTDMIAAFDAIKAAGTIPLANTVTDSWMLPIEQEIFGAGTYGGRKFLDKMLSGSAKFTDPAWTKSVDQWISTQKYWGENYKGTSYQDAQALFTSGKAATFPGGIWELANFRKATPNLQLGVFNPPAPDGSGTPVPGYVDGSFGISKNSKNQAESLKLINWMASKEFGQAFSDELSQYSPVPGVQTKDPLLAEAISAYTANSSPYITFAYFSGGKPTAWDLASTAFSSVVLGQSSSSDAAGKIQQGVNQWFKPQK